MPKHKFTFKEMIAELSGEDVDFPKYTTQLMNLANQNSQATRPKKIGQLSDYITKCPAKDYAGWCEWYTTRRPYAIKKASRKIYSMIEKLRVAIDKIDLEMVEAWVKDLILDKTYVGLKVQEAIIKKLARMMGLPWRLATPAEESKGIDGYIGKTPVSIKPSTYNCKNMLHEEIDVKIIYYEKKKSGIIIEYNSL